MWMWLRIRFCPNVYYKTYTDIIEYLAISISLLSRIFSNFLSVTAPIEQKFRCMQEVSNWAKYFSAILKFMVRECRRTSYSNRDCRKSIGSSDFWKWNYHIIYSSVLTIPKTMAYILICTQILSMDINYLND